MDELAAWAPPAQRATDRVSAGAVRALHLLLDLDGAPEVGTLLPPMWHWLAFNPRVRQRDIRADGHPATDPFAPPVPWARRMFAGGTTVFHAPLPADAEIVRLSQVGSVDRKQGRAGSLVFVGIDHELRVDGVLAAEERQDIVYIAPGDAAADSGAARAPEREAGDWDFQRPFPIDPVRLFRFSALTYNGHRIHYDRTYATTVEGYPGLVVHGPLQAIALLELLRAELDGPAVGSFSFRALRPAFDDGPLRLRGRQEEGRFVLEATDPAGGVTMTAEAVG